MEKHKVCSSELFHLLACRSFGGGKDETYGRAVCLTISVSVVLAVTMIFQAKSWPAARGGSRLP